MSRPTWASTDRSLTAPLALLLALATGLAAGSVPGRFKLVVLALAGACIVGATLGDGFVGLLAGVLAAAAYVELGRLFGTWGPASFPLAATTSALLVLLGWNTGTSAAATRAAGRTGQGAAGTTGAPGAAGAPGVAAEPVQPGLFTLAHGMLRLEEEIHRGRAGGLPLALLVVRTSVVDAALDAAARASARRAVARVVVSRTRRTDVPFSTGPGEVCTILPVTDPADAWIVLAAVLGGIAEAVFTDRAQSPITPVTDFVEVETSVVFLGAEHSTAAQLLEAAQASLRESPTARPSGPS